MEMKKLSEIIKRRGTLLSDVPEFPSDMLEILKDLSYHTVEQLVSSYNTSIDTWERGYPDFDFKHWMPILGRLVPEETKIHWKDLSKLEFPTGGLTIDSDVE
jgi:hypothetical protein